MDNFEVEINQIKSSGLDLLDKIDNLEDLDNWKQNFIGRKARFNEILKNISKLESSDLKRKYGQMANSVKTELAKLYDLKSTAINSQKIMQQIELESLDITLPGISSAIGHKHPLSEISSRIIDIFLTLGFEPVEGPEVETEFYNFDALNIDINHPARDEQDTFYTNIDDNILLRSQTSTVQIRAMEKMEPPLKIVSIGRVYRNEEINARKFPIFHQIEGLYINKNVNFGHLKWTLQKFINSFFESDLKIRLRPDFFPFTEPSAEVDCECPFCNTQGCKTCGFKGWLEILGCGMVHPNVLQNVGKNYSEYSGFAFGMGLERLAMIKYGINDIRYFYQNDLRFLQQF